MRPVQFRLTLTVLTVLLTVGAVSQNRVLNGSFETITTCPTGRGQVHLAPPWYRTYNMGALSGIYTPDIFSRCHINWTLVAGTPGTFWLSVPVNGFGVQVPRTGDNYFGIACDFPNGVTSGQFAYEYFSAPIMTLDSGRNYKLRFFVNLADGFSSPDFIPNPNVYIRSSSVAIEQIGGSLTDTNLLITAPQPVPWYYNNFYYNIPTTVEHSGSVLDDTLNWTEISGVFTATGRESFISLGVFHHPWQLNYFIRWIDNANPFYASYYYIDDVSICPTDTIIPPGDAGRDTLICQGDSLLLGTPCQANWYYRWHPGPATRDSLSAQTWVRPWHTTTYVLEATDPCFTKTYDTVIVWVNECGPQAGKDTVVCLENPVILGDSINFSYHCQWVPATFLDNDTLPMPTCVAYTAAIITYVMTALDSLGNPVRTDTVTVNAVDCTGMEDVNSVQVRPFNIGYDASSGTISVYPANSCKEGYMFQLFDIHGRIVRSTELNPVSAAQIDVSALPPGIYIWVVESKGTTEWTGKIVLR